MLIAGMLQRLIKEGRLVVVDAVGTTHEFGEPPGSSLSGSPLPRSRLVVRLTDRAIVRAILLSPDMAMAEGYMDGRIVIEEGTLYDLLELVFRNWAKLRPGPFARLAGKALNSLSKLHQFNPASRARRNVAHHYDLSSALYELFLDPDRQYSCAYFPNAETGLDTAQLLKKRHIAAKLLLQPGQKVLDIGSGWGGLAIYLAQVDEVDVTGLTLSTEQHSHAARRVREAGLDERVRFAIQDYRATTGTFDRIVSVGMFEHVGLPHYDAYFRLIHDRLADDGVALVHTIGVVTEPRPIAGFIRKYIFPGAHTPSLSQMMPAIEASGLKVTDIEVLRLHYAETLRIWRQRFLARREQAAALYDERFCRMWEFYLVSCELFFRWSGGVVFQIQLAKDQAAVPLTRDYIEAEEKRLARAEPCRYRLVA